MEKPLFWIIDDEWPDYSVEEAALKAACPDCHIRYSGIPFQKDLEDFGDQVDVVFAQVSADITAQVIAKLPRCKGIAVFGSGYNNVDVQAAKAAHAHGFIMSMPGGYDMQLHEGASNIAQGQRQLLTIARAFLSDPEILILDEATSSVDTRTEVAIQKAMNKLMEGRTSFVIAHRLSTIKDAQLIVYMEHGDIKEVGNHKELLAKGGYYAALYNSQFAAENAG